MHWTNGLRRIVAIAAFVVGCSPMAMAADGGIWSVSKSSGEVWVTAGGAEQDSPISQVSLGSDHDLKPGDTIRTGRNGRVLLVRGEETIVIAPNSVVGLPTESKDGMATTILQRAGSILLDVEKRNVKHFEVETPYLAAVVKGTHFSVTINADHTKVAVERGQVEVSDFKSGQIAQILPGQSAMAFDHGKPGLSLSGTGTFTPIEQGKSRQSSITRVPVPRNGITAPRDAKGVAVHAMKPVDATPVKNAAASGQPHAVPGTPAPIQSAQGNRPLAQPIIHQGLQHGSRPVIRIATSIGEVKLNVQQATHGLAHSSVTAGGGRSRGKDTGSVWSGNSGTSGGNGNASGSASSSNATASAVAAAIGSANASASWSANGATGNGTKGTSTSSTSTATASSSSSTASSGMSGSVTTTTGDGGTTTTGNGNSGGSTGGGGNSGSGNGNSGSGGGNSGNGGNGHHYGWWNNWWNSWQGHGRGG